MREIGGYIEFEHFHGKMMHENAIALNSGRNCLALLFKSKKIRKLKIPFFICDSIINVCDREGVEKSYYHIDINFRPLEEVVLDNDEWLYLVNFYGQLTNTDIKYYIRKYKRVIVDQANDYFAEPIYGIDTIYTCRKWFGVADGAFLYTLADSYDDFPQDESFDRMRFLFGRFERSANEFYAEYDANNKFFNNQPIKKMSKLTINILHGIDYYEIKKRREDNFSYLSDKLNVINMLHLNNARFMYPLMVGDGTEIRKKLLRFKIYVPILWPSVLNVAKPDSLEYKMVSNILPLPIDQRYDTHDMEYLAEMVMRCINEV